MIEAVVSQLGTAAAGASPGGAPRLQITGLKGAARALAVAEWVVREKRPALVVLPTEREAESFYRDLAFFLGVEDTDAPAAPGTHADLVRFAADDFKAYEIASPDPDDAVGRVEALWRLAHHDRPVAVVTSARGLARRTIPRAALEKNAELIQVDEDLDREAFLAFLANAGYARVSVVEDRGTFAVRGGILDVWPPLHPKPLRIEFFGDQVDSIRSFDVGSQRARDTLREAIVLPVREVVFGPEQIASARHFLERIASDKSGEALAAVERKFAFSGVESIIPWLFASPDGTPRLETALDYLPERAAIFRIEPLGIERELLDHSTQAKIAYEGAQHDHRAVPDPSLLFADHDSLFTTTRRMTIDVSDLEVGTGETKSVRMPMESTSTIRAEIQAAAGTSPDQLLKPLAERVKRWQAEGTKVVFVCHSPSQGERLLFLLSKYHVNVQLDENDDAGARLVDPKSGLRASPEEVTVLLGELTSGFHAPGAHLVVVPEAEVFGERSHRRRAKAFADAKAIQAISDLKPGDLVVHKDYGIGTFKGITRVESTAPTRSALTWLPGSGDGPPPPAVDFVHLEYQSGDKLYVPVYKMNLVQKYTAGEGETITLDKLGGTGWDSRKKKVSAAVAKMARELLDLYARREMARRPAFGVHPEVASFEARFEYEETEDQLAAIEKIHEDLSSPKPMDRLVCGDVGYGKTEVALRAAARVAFDGKQVAVLVPTTILAQQHGRTFMRRFADSPVTVEVLSRFQSASETKDVLARLKDGKVDVVVGTHRLLGKEVKFKDLGLVVVDEEHRFGVTHKERLKSLRAHVDVLTLSATPIPRTLHMSMSGLRDLSLIETPPEDRLPIRTFVTKFDGTTIREAAMRELSRGGQIYFVHNRVQNIGALASYVQKCVPEARVGIAHGQMSPDDLERVMIDFVEKKYDILVATAIIESGLDIPSANTMIINRADRFGLAQLYQLRGRVGRSSQRAYCVMLIPPGDVLSGDALERLATMQEYTELGSGFRVAQRDLEIRGAGNLLGANQSGFINAVGFDLYVSLLKKEVDALRQGDGGGNGAAAADQPLDIEPEINLKIAALIPEGYIQDPRFRVGFYRRLSSAKDDDELGEVRDELRDRFGILPNEVENLVHVLLLKRKLQKLGVRDLSFDGKDLVLLFDPRTKVNPERLVRMAAKEPKRYRLTPEQRFKMRVTSREDVISEAKALLELLS